MHPPRCFSVRVANKGLTRDVFVRVADNRVKVACFDIVNGWSIRAANKGVTGELPCRNGDVLMPRALERTTWREDICHLAQEIAPLKSKPL